jgi:hypothetical protein
MTIKLYELAGAEDNRRFSPYCWRIRFALEHKQLEFETVACRFTDNNVIAFSGQNKVPVLVDGNEVVSDSWAIACHLEQTYPDRPSLSADRLGTPCHAFTSIGRTQRCMAPSFSCSRATSMLTSMRRTRCTSGKAERSGLG